MLNEGLGLNLSDRDVETALIYTKKFTRLDGYGLCPRIFWALTVACRGLLTPIINKVSASMNVMKSIIIRGHACAKKRGVISANAVLVILPLPCVLAILDSHLAASMTSFLEPLLAGAGQVFLKQP